MIFDPIDLSLLILNLFDPSFSLNLDTETFMNFPPPPWIPTHLEQHHEEHVDGGRDRTILGDELFLKVLFMPHLLNWQTFLIMICVIMTKLVLVKINILSQSKDKTKYSNHLSIIFILSHCQIQDFHLAWVLCNNPKYIFKKTVLKPSLYRYPLFLNICFHVFGMWLKRIFSIWDIFIKKMFFSCHGSSCQCHIF